MPRHDRGILRDIHDPGRRRVLIAGVMASGSGCAGALYSPGLAAHERDSDRALVVEPVPAQVPAQEGIAELADAKLWYWDTGGPGEPIVLLHPMTGSGHVWLYQQPALAKAGYRVIGYSRRGFRNSSKVSADNPGTGCEDLRQLLDFLKIDRFHAVSTAGGAFVAADFAVSHGQRIKTLVLACTMLGIDEGRMAQLTSVLRTPGFEGMPASFRELSPSYRALNPEGTRHWEELERNSRSAPGPQVRQPMANKLTVEVLRRLKMPTLLISGESDLIAPPPVARLFAQYIPGCELVLLRECGHSAYWERPTLFNQAVLEFVGRHRV